MRYPPTVHECAFVASGPIAGSLKHWTKSKHYPRPANNDSHDNHKNKMIIIMTIKITITIIHLRIYIYIFILSAEHI